VQSPVEAMPTEVLTQVFSTLSKDPLTACCQVSRNWHAVAFDQTKRRVQESVRSVLQELGYILKPEDAIKLQQAVNVTEMSESVHAIILRTIDVFPPTEQTSKHKEIVTKLAAKDGRSSFVLQLAQKCPEGENLELTLFHEALKEKKFENAGYIALHASNYELKEFVQDVSERCKLLQVPQSQYKRHLFEYLASQQKDSLCELKKATIRSVCNFSIEKGAWDTAYNMFMREDAQVSEILIANKNKIFSGLVREKRFDQAIELYKKFPSHVVMYAFCQKEPLHCIVKGLLQGNKLDKVLELLSTLKTKFTLRCLEHMPLLFEELVKANREAEIEKLIHFFDDFTSLDEQKEATKVVAIRALIRGKKFTFAEKLMNTSDDLKIRNEFQDALRGCDDLEYILAYMARITVSNDSLRRHVVSELVAAKRCDEAYAHYQLISNSFYKHDAEKELVKGFVAENRFSDAWKLFLLRCSDGFDGWCKHLLKFMCDRHARSVYAAIPSITDSNLRQTIVEEFAWHQAEKGNIKFAYQVCMQYCKNDDFPLWMQKGVAWAWVGCARIGKLLDNLLG